MRSLLSVRGFNLCGNILTGLCASVLGISWIGDSTGRSVPLAALLLLLCSGFSLALCLNPRRERPDEMARVHEGVSSSIALKLLLLACAVLCCSETVACRSLPIAPACCLCIGLGLMAYGISFAYLERE